MIRKTATQWAQPYSARDVPIVCSTLGEEAGLLGAGILHFNYSNPKECVMSANEYFERAIPILQKIQTTQMDAIERAGKACANSISVGRAAHVYGSGHSVIPVMDMFPRYGAYVGFHPIMDPRTMWFNITVPVARAN